MSDYLRWVLRQFYLLLFWPSKFAREVEGEKQGQPQLTRKQRLVYLLKMLPWLLALAMLANLLAGSLCEAFGSKYYWAESWLGVAVGVAFGVAFPVAFGVAVGVVGGFVDGIAFGVAFGVAFPVAFYLTYFRLGTYPVDAFLSWLAFAEAKARPTTAFRWWRRCPVAWNEVIYLPLPGVGKLLALATRQNRVEGFRQIAFVAAERPLQRRVAIEALTEVALGDLEASTASELALMPDRMPWTGAAPLALPAAFASALPRFDRIAHQVGQSLSVSSAYRKADALKRAVEEVDVLQKTLVVSEDALAPRLLQVANQWREILEAEEARLEQLAAERRETPNPFVFGNPVDERNASVFAGRRDVARQIEESLLGARQSPTLLLHGPRRMGKTSILKQLPRLLGPDFAPAELDCQNPAVAGGEASAGTLLRYLSGSLSEGLQRRRVAVKPLSAGELAREPFAAFDLWLDRAEKAMPPGMRALLCLDEYEKLQRALDAGWGGDFLDALRHTLQHRPRFVLLFTGAHTFAELGPAWTDRFISARRVRVSFLTPDEVLPLLTQPIPEFDLTYAPGALEALIEATHGQPFLTQAVAFELVQYLNEQQRKGATPADAEMAISRALESSGDYFANVWSDAGERGQAILRAFARGQPPPDFPDARLRLREHDVLNDEGKFAVPMMERWVKENAE
ncbi:MAG: ATP-binding protein [Verrucomicrobiota bacterium]